jgi:hypothetical protein
MLFLEVSGLFLAVEVKIMGRRIAAVDGILDGLAAGIGFGGCCETASRKHMLSGLQGFSVCAGLESKTEGSIALLISVGALQGCNSRSCPLEQGLVHR